MCAVVGSPRAVGSGGGDWPDVGPTPVDSGRRRFHSVGIMWGYAEGNSTLVGIVVVIVALAAIGYVGRRLWRRER